MMQQPDYLPTTGSTTSKDETASLSGHNSHSKNYYGSNGYGIVSSGASTNSTQPSSLLSSFRVKRTKHHHQNYQYNIRFMVMIFTGLTFFICVSFVFIQSSMLILHNRRQQQQSENNFRTHQHHQGTASTDRSEEFVCCCSNSNDNRNTASSTSCTFRQLGLSMIPSAYQSMMDAIQQHLYATTEKSNINDDTTTTSVQSGTASSSKFDTYTMAVQPPSQVNKIRKQILYVRDLLDIFSPIYTNTTTTATRKDSNMTLCHTQEAIVGCDPWTTIRSELDYGYTLIGQYQDLDHSHVQYTQQQISVLQSKIIQWYNQLFIITTTSFTPDTTTTTTTTTTRSNDDYHPSSNTTTAGRSTSFAMQYLSLQNNEFDAAAATITTTMTTWYTHTTESRLFWKGIDHVSVVHYQQNHMPKQQQQQHLGSINDSAITALQLLFLKQINLAKKYYIKAYQHVSVLHSDLEQIDYHNLRKVLRCIVDEYNMFFSSTSTSSSSLKCTIPMVCLDPNIITITTEDIRTFDTAREMLGDLNDDWNAYKFYTNHQRDHDKKETSHYDENDADISSLIKSIDTRWDTFKNWSTDTVNMLEIFARQSERRSNNHFNFTVFS